MTKFHYRNHRLQKSAEDLLNSNPAPRPLWRYIVRFIMGLFG